MTGTVRFGVVGSGFMGQTWARVISGHVPEAHLVAVAGGRGAADLATQHGVDVHDPESLFRRDDIDAVVIATPVPTHRPLVEAAARAGKHAIVEKPMTNTRADADSMVAAADAAGVRLAVVSQHRFRGAPVAAKAAIDAGRIGSIRMVRVFGPNAGWDIPVDSWNSDSAQVTPYMDWGAHACDIVRWLTGSEATLAFGQFGTYSSLGPTGQSSMVHYTLADGVMVQIWLSYELTEPSLGSAMQLLITGSDGLIELDSYGTVRLGTPTGGWETIYDQTPFDPLNPDDPIRLQAYALQLRDLIRAIGDGTDPFVSGRQGALTTSMLEAAERSAATGASVRLPLGG
jgi:predicted dehydrogenase